ncbi:MAG: beta-ketoacyl-[acyl-carrier-protein] synthase family protein [Rhizobacter sp.]
MNNPVGIAGYGVISPLGNDLRAFDEALFNGRSAVGPMPLALPGQDLTHVPAARCTFEESEVRAASNLPLDRGTAMAIGAADSAMAAAGLTPGGVDPERLGVYWGSGMGGATTFEATCRALYAEQRRIRPTTIVSTMPNAPVAELALRWQARGAALAYACACASAAVAIGEALIAIRAGRIDVAIAGGSESLLSPGVVGAWQAMRVLAALGNAAPARVCRPFAADRSGFALGEGAAALVLESDAHARARGAVPTVGVAGYATNCDGKHITQPDPSGQARAMAAALRDAGLGADDIRHVNAHGTATSFGDAAEAESIARVFGGSRPAVTATKAVIGHLLGAGGAVEFVATLRALECGLVPPTAHVVQADPAFTIDLVVGEARRVPGLRHALSNSFAFGGTNAVLVASRLD